MENVHHRVCRRIYAREIRALVRIAPGTCPSQIRGAIILPVLLGDDMLDVESPVHRMLRQAAVLAPIAGTESHKLAKRFVDHPA